MNLSYAGTSRCELCHEACSDCSGGLNTYSNCNVCATGYLSKNDNIDPKCQKCFGTCAACTDFTFDSCTSCEYGSFLIDSECRTTCPDGYYTLEASALCQLCKSPCLTCVGPLNGHCLTCDTGLYLYNYFCDTTCPASLYAYNGICVAACPIKTYATLTKICVDCPNTFCLTCNSAGQCLTCELNSYLNPFDFICYDNCPAGLYGDLSSGLCIQCDSQCLTCFGPTET